MAILQVVFLLILLTALEVSAQGSDTTFGIFRQKEYYFSNSFKLNWFKAAEYCRTRGMFLVSVRNAEEREALIEYVNSTGYTKTHNILPVWTSANDLGEEGEFHWASTGDRLNYVNWYKGEPNNSKSPNPAGENCVDIAYWADNEPSNNYKFNDRSCTDEVLFICETLPA